MPESDHGIPSKGGSGGLIAIGIVMLLAAGGLVLFKMNSDSDEPEVVEEVTKKPVEEEAAAPVLDNAPPPPPSEEELEEEEKAESQEQATAKTAPRGPAGCSGSCAGQAGSALRSALATRGASARSCYNTALRRNVNLQGKMTVNVRLSPTGAVCSVSIGNDTMGDAAVSSCVAAKFRAAKFPAPTGGCVDTAVPLNFTSKQ